MCLGKFSKDFTINNMKKTGLKETVKVDSVNYNSIDTNDTLDIHRYLMKETMFLSLNIKPCLELLKNCFFFF